MTRCNAYSGLSFTGGSFIRCRLERGHEYVESDSSPAYREVMRDHLWWRGPSWIEREAGFAWCEPITDETTP